MTSASCARSQYFLMSALGQKLPRDLTRGAAALPPKAAAAVADQRVCFGPKADSCNATKSALGHRQTCQRTPGNFCQGCWGCLPEWQIGRTSNQSFKPRQPLRSDTWPVVGTLYKVDLAGHRKYLNNKKAPTNRPAKTIVPPSIILPWLVITGTSRLLPRGRVPIK
jgi:hypothetical protein